jgi:hypothetical protein
LQTDGLQAGEAKDQFAQICGKSGPVFPSVATKGLAQGKSILDCVMNDLIMLPAFLDGPSMTGRSRKLAGFLSGSSEMHNNLVRALLKRFVKQGGCGAEASAGSEDRSAAFNLSR